MKLPPMSKRKNKEPYPMPDEQHARSAIGFAEMHHPGSSVVAEVKAKARRKYPGMNIKARGGRAQAHVEGRKSKHRLDRKH
jgi:hypothetical protein